MMEPTDIVEGIEYANGRGTVRKVLRIWNADSKIWRTSVEYKVLAKGVARGQKQGSAYTCALDRFARWAHRRVNNELPCGHTYADLMPNPDRPGKVQCSACQGQATHIGHLLGQLKALCDAKEAKHPEITDHKKRGRYVTSPDCWSGQTDTGAPARNPGAQLAHGRNCRMEHIW